MLTELIHNGVVVLDPPPYLGLVLKIRGESVKLTPKQEEMALAWAKKAGTEYVEDPTFVANFLADFSAELGLDDPLAEDEVDLGPANRVVEEEKAAKEAMSKEERKALAAERKAQREALRERHGHAIVNGEQVELANYVVEPSGIFMGRGQHPLRGRWKEGATRADVTLNLSPGAPRPEGDWAEIVWQPESLWVARWRDKLADKLKYVWLSDSAPIKQEREAQKFDKVYELDAEIDTVREQIIQDLADDDDRRRRIATACYLIDALCLRVGDEKDEDEADTVGATTLRPEHVTLHDDGTVEFRFLGKDSVLWHKQIPLPEIVCRNLQELIENARPSSASSEGESPTGNGENGTSTRDKPQLFHDITSRNVNAYLSDVLPGLTAKVFRTHHATVAVRRELESSGVSAEDPEHKKWGAANMANLEAAVLCNHTKKEAAGWERSRERYRERQAKAEERVETACRRLEEQQQALAQLEAEAREQQEGVAEEKREQVARRYEKRLASARNRIEKAREQLDKAEIARDKIEVQKSIASQKRTWNLGTSLKSYIDPRVYYEWGTSVDYDVIERYYPKALRQKFAWVRNGEDDDLEDAEE
ncbi:MAG TPA: DNA topoisomerase I [Anaerolineae bacterium]|nr:DNA topoisomerase I [Anaerolineae bacterium]